MGFMEYDMHLSGQVRRLTSVFFLLVLICGWGITGSSLAESVSSDNLSASETPINFTILAINDFHGQVTAGKMVNNTPVGSMGVLASYLLQAINATGENHTIIALPGDMTGTSPPESGLLLDEPTLLYYNLFSGNSSGDRPYHAIASCPIVATVGNHEFDRSLSELNRKIYGGNGTTTFPHLQDPYPGSDAAVIASNILVTKTGKPFLPPYTIREVDGVSVAFIGAVTSTTPHIVTLDNVKDLTFLDEADSINRQVETLKIQGIHAFVILLHEGGSQNPYEGETRSDVPVTGRIVDIVSRLDSDVDVVLSGHTHEFTNAYLQNAGGRPVLVTQAYSYSKAFAHVSLSFDPVSDDIIWKTASIVTPYADRSPGNIPNPEASRLMNDTLRIIGPLVNGVISFTDMNITTGRNSDGESNLYDLVTDSMRVAMNSDVAVLNEGAVRADIYPGNITLGKAYEMLPFGNNIITVNMTGEQIHALVEQQWNRTIRPDHMLQISGFNYTYDDTRSINNRVLSISQNGTQIKPGKNYSVATVPFLAGGGDGYTVMKLAMQGVTGPLDIDALVPYMKSLKTPVVLNPDGRITRVIAGDIQVTGVQPAFGTSGETVPVAISGGNFTAGVSVSLHNGEYLITGEGVSVPLPTTILCSLNISDSVGSGGYDLLVQDLNGKSGVLRNAFSVLPRPSPLVQRISPGILRSGSRVSMVIRGENFMSGTVPAVERDRIQIQGKYPVTVSNRTISCSFTIPKGYPGEWNVSVINPDGQSGRLTRAFRVTD